MASISFFNRHYFKTIDSFHQTHNLTNILSTQKVTSPPILKTTSNTSLQKSIDQSIDILRANKMLPERLSMSEQKACRNWKSFLLSSLAIDTKKNFFVLSILIFFIFCLVFFFCVTFALHKTILLCK